MIWQPWKIWYENIRNFQGWWSKHSTGTATAVDLELRCEVVAYLLMSIGGVLLLLLVQLQPALELPEGFVDGQHQPFLQYAALPLRPLCSLVEPRLCRTKPLVERYPASPQPRSQDQTSDLDSLKRISYAVF